MSLALGMALAGECALDAPPDTPFAMPAPAGADRVRLLLEVWTDEESIGWAADVIAVLTERNLPGILVVPFPKEPPSADLLELLSTAVATGHEIGVVFAADDVPRDMHASTKSYRQRLQWFRRAGIPIKVAASPLPGRVSEALLGRLGFKTILLLRGPASSQPRLAAVFEGQPRINVVLHGGPYTGDCGTSPEVEHFTPRAADRVTRAVAGAARSDGAPTVRMALHPTQDSETDARVLGRWLDEVTVPAKVQITNANRARIAALQAIRTRKTAPIAEDAGGGRLVNVADLHAVAMSLADENVIPRLLPGDMNVTEAFYGFLILLAGREEGDIVRLGSLAGPSDTTENRVQGIIEIDEEALRKLAGDLLDELPTEVPAALPVGDTLLDAAELFTAMASTVRGDEPPRTWPTASPDPNNRGLGWGQATLP